MLEGLKPGFEVEVEIGYDISLPEYIAFQIIYRMFLKIFGIFLKAEIKGRTYEIKRDDNKNIINLFRVIDEDDPEDYLELIIRN